MSPGIFAGANAFPVIEFTVPVDDNLQFLQVHRCRICGDRPAAIRARSQEFDLRLYLAVRPCYLQNVVSVNFHIRTSFGLHQHSVATVHQYGSRNVQFDLPQRQFEYYRMADQRFKGPFHRVTHPGLV